MHADATLAAYYARRATEYERIYQKPERQADLLRLRAFVERAFAGKRVLELACGTGYWTQILARSAASVVACDLNPEVLTLARSKPIDPTKVEFRVADAYALPEWPRCFDAGLAAFWWSHVPKSRLPAFLNSFHRMFARGARVVFLDNNFVQGSSTPIARVDAEGNTYQDRRLDDGSVHEVLKNFPTGPELRATLRGVAVAIEIQLLQYYWTLSYTPEFHE